MLPEITVETSCNGEGLPGHKLSELIPKFLRFGQFELSYATETVKKYREALNWVIKDLGDRTIESLGYDDLTILKQKIALRGGGDARVASITFALKSLLKYCGEELELPVISYRKVKSPKRRRREVIYLTNEEVNQFLESIPIWKGWNGKKPGKYLRMDALRFRTLVEVLLGTGMRISEALALNRDSIDFERGEAKIIGKGNKERVVFFNARSLEWIRFYIKSRVDNEKALFITREVSRLNRADVSKLFKTYREKARIGKKLTPHILRHTVATNLLFNGCPISHVKEILGHENLETTCKYYLGLDKSRAKEAQRKYLFF